MASWQSKLIRLAFRIGRSFSSRTDPEDIEKKRRGLEKLSQIFSPSDDSYVERIEYFDIDELRAAWIIPKNAQNNRVILYLHGGAYCIGSIESHRMLVGRISLAAEAKSLMIEYRLAPENKFPSALEDTIKAYDWLITQGFSPEQIVIVGDSAGGGLALSMLLWLRDSGNTLPRMAICLSPWVDLSRNWDSNGTEAKKDPFLTPQGLTIAAQRYLGDEDPRNPLASPLYGDLKNLPSLFIQVGTDEILLDEAVRIADKARKSGVDVTLDVGEGMIHVWQAFAPFVPESNQAIRSIGAFVKERMGELPVFDVI